MLCFIAPLFLFFFNPSYLTYTSSWTEHGLSGMWCIWCLYG